MEELFLNNILVVCVGVKLILDLGFILEYLEIKGVEVLGYNIDKLFVFYFLFSEFNIIYNICFFYEVVFIMKEKWEFINGGIVLVNFIFE